MMRLTKLIGALKRLLTYFIRFFKGQSTEPPCAPCPPALKRPDPFLYAQYFLIGLGLPVTWDNPDIYIFEGNVRVDPHDLKAQTDYTVLARIWNSSPDVPVLDLRVFFSYLSFGMGVQNHPIGMAETNLNAKGLPGCPAFAAIKWTTPTTVGHYCVQVWLDPPDDSNWLNNLGQLNTDVAHAASPAGFTFDVGNHASPRPRRVNFTVDTYRIPPLPRCDSDREVIARHRQIATAAQPVPAGWTVEFVPSQLTLAPGAEQPVVATITPPPGFAGTLPFNVTAWDEIGAFGGVTLTVQVP